MATRRSTTGRRARGTSPSTRSSIRRNRRSSASSRVNGGSIGNVAGLGGGARHAGRVRSRGQGAPAHVASARGARTPLSPSPGNAGSPFEGIAISRRTLIAGAVGVGAVAALGGTALFVSSQSQHDDEVTVLEVPESAVTSTDDLGDAEPVENHMALGGSFDLPYGTLLWSSDEQLAACLVPCDTANPLCQVGLLPLSSGNLSIVLERAVGTQEGFQIYDARANSHGVIWVEEDILENTWRIYTAALSADLVLGEPALAGEGGGDWETPSIAVAGSRAWWQEMPKPDTDASAENSLVKTVAFGSDAAEVAYTSPGRLATPVYSAQDCVIVTPRVDTDGVYYQLTRLDAESVAVTDSLVLPQGMAPLEAGWGANGFMFSFDAIYDYGGGIANLGTYCPAQDARGGDYSAVPWFRFSRTPSAAPAWCGDYLMVKSTTSVCGVDMASGTWFSLGVESGTDDYGDYLASTGTSEAIVTYSNIDHTPLDGEAIHCCRVSVWRPL